jgi:hypothetical protein
MKTARSWICWPIWGMAFALTPPACAQVAAVTLKLDATSIAVAGTTTLHVYAQVVPAQRAKVDRIFSWDVDVLNSNGSAADSTGTPIKATSDKTAQISSSGVMDGANRLGIYDTFLNLAGAGVSNAVELFSVPIKGLAQGNVSFNVQASVGSGPSQDFIVAPIGGGDRLLGAITARQRRLWL